MFSVSQYTSELQQYNYFVMQEPVFEEKIKEPVFTFVYEENGILYCASSTSERGYYYTYCLNNPSLCTDPSGELTWLDIGAGLLLVGGIIGEVFAPGNPWSTAVIVSGFSHFAYTIKGVEDGGVTWDEASSYAGIYAEIPPIDINWPNFNDNDVVEYDPGATYEHPVTGQEYFANSGSETFDNTLANGGYYKNPGDMNYKASYDIYFGSNYLSGYVPAIDKLFCVFENAEYLSSVFYGGYDTNDYLRITQKNNPEIDVFKVKYDYYTIMRSNFKIGKSIETYSDIYHRINDGQPVSALIPGKPYHAVSIIGYNTTSYELIYMDPQIGIRRFTPQEILKLLGSIPVKRAK